jgi:hypothetical protein
MPGKPDGNGACIANDAPRVRESPAGAGPGLWRPCCVGAVYCVEGGKSSFEEARVMVPPSHAAQYELIHFATCQPGAGL